MSSDVDAVIAALRIALREAESRTDYRMRVRTVNRWVSQ
jgi:hypothetical protein